MSAVKREAEMAKADKKAHAEAKTQTPATAGQAAVAETPAVPAKAAPAKRNSRIKPIQDAIVPLLRTAKTVKELATRASEKLGSAVTEREVRGAIDRARRGANNEPPIKIDRVAPLTFQIVDGKTKAA